MLRGCEADKAHTWRIAVTEFLVFAFGSLVAAACNGVSMKKTAKLVWLRMT